MSHCDQEVRKALKECFDQVDKDKSGFIDQTELENVIKNYLKHPKCSASYKANYSDPKKITAECADFMKAADVSGDKKISFDEFVKYFCKK